jgi:cellulose synthase/poly-beta-1,6-N-acetylglucosamine synthase-like glycosyltransferase
VAPRFRLFLSIADKILGESKQIRVSIKMPHTQRFFPLVTILVPCRNEKAFIGKCIDSIIANNYPKDKVEILVIDGISEDGTR